MAKNQVFDFSYRFAWSHIQTDGKLDNLTEALGSIKAQKVSLSLCEPGLDDRIMDPSVIEERLARLNVVIKKLHRQDIECDLILPGLGEHRPADANYKKYIKSLYSRTAHINIQTLWVDDTSDHDYHRFPRNQMLKWHHIIRRAVHTTNQGIRIGLIAADPVRYALCALSANEIALTLAGPYPGLLAQSQAFVNDYCRTDILKARRTLALIRSQYRSEIVELTGYNDHAWASPFAKSAEADQMQINLNALYGLKKLMINCFDKVGTAPGEENLYLTMHQNRRRFINKLTSFMPDTGQSYPSIRIIIPDFTQEKIKLSAEEITSQCQTPWPVLLWRWGLRAGFVSTSAVKSGDKTGSVYILTGQTPRFLSRRQFNHIFKCGVLLDAQAAQTIQDMNLPGLIGTKVGTPIKNVQTEIISDQTFAAPYYGYHTILAGHFVPDDFRSLKPFHNNARVVTTLVRKNHLPNTPGMILFDNVDHNHRCAILPYSLDKADAAPLLTIERQRHFREIFTWLRRGRLDCFVENTPDLALFYIPDAAHRRLILGLLNIGFDWALKSRIRLNHLPFKVKRVRELDEQGLLVEHPKLKLTLCRDYQYLHLNTNTAVPPMQMTVLVLED